MTTKRYEFTGEKKTVDGILLKQIRRLDDGAVGGWINNQKCLPQHGSGWVFPNGVMYGGVMYGGVMYGGEMYGGEMYGGEMYGGKMHGGEMYGGVMHGGKMHGGEMYGGEMYGGVIHKGMIVTRDPIYIVLPKHHITVADNMAAVGCEVHGFAYWREHIEEIGEKYRYSKEEIVFYKTMLFTVMDEMETRNTEDVKKKGISP